MTDEITLTKLLNEFLGLENDDEALAFVSEHQELLTAEAIALLEQDVQGSSDSPGASVKLERLSMLRALSAMASMSPNERLFGQFLALESERQMLAFAMANPPEALDRVEKMAEEFQDEDIGTDGTAAIRERLASLREIRTRLEEDDGQTQQMSDAEKAEISARLEEITGKLAAWIATDDWRASKRYLEQHQAELLADEGFAAMKLLMLQNPQEELLKIHMALLQLSREEGIDAAYAQFRKALQEAVSQTQEARHRPPSRSAPRRRKRMTSSASDNPLEGCLVQAVALVIGLMLFIIWMSVDAARSQARSMTNEELLAYAMNEETITEADFVSAIESASARQVTAPAFQPTRQAIITSSLIRQRALVDIEAAYANRRLLTVLQLAELFINHGGEADPNFDEVEEMRQEAVRIRNEQASIHAQLMEATEAQEPLTVIEDLVEEYLALSSDADLQEKHEVISAYSRAFVFWYGRQATPLDDAANDHVQRYRRLVVAPELVNEGIAFIVAGNVPDGLERIEKAMDYDPEIDISASDWHDICRFGGLWGFPSEVEAACDSAVDRAIPSQQALFRDSRGLSRAQLGDYEGAASDFEAFAEWAKERGDFGDAKRREEWIQELNEHRNPFTGNLLATLRAETLE